MSIQLESGRLALRRPELGGFLMVEVERWSTTFVDGTDSTNYFQAEGNPYLLTDFLPVLRPGDVVPAGSLLWNIYGRFKQHVVEDNEIRSYQSLVFALLRYGPEEATDD